MKVNRISNDVSFGRLKVNIDNDLLKFAPIKREISKIRTIFQENGFSRKKNVDVILSYDRNDGSFVGVIESKKQGVPNNPDYSHSISSKKKDVKSFGEWLATWDYMYSPKGLKEMAEIKRKALECLKKRLHIVSIWKESML